MIMNLQPDNKRSTTCTSYSAYMGGCTTDAKLCVDNARMIVYHGMVCTCIYCVYRGVSGLRNRQRISPQALV